MDREVGVAPAGFDELQVHGAHSLLVLVHHGFSGSPALLGVASHTPNQTNVRLRVDEDRQVHDLSQLRVCEHQNPVEDDRGRGM